MLLTCRCTSAALRASLYMGHSMRSCSRFSADVTRQRLSSVGGACGGGGEGRRRKRHVSGCVAPSGYHTWGCLRGGRHAVGCAGQWGFTA